MEKGLSFHSSIPPLFLYPNPSLPGTPEGIPPSVFFIHALLHPFISSQSPSAPNSPPQEKGCREDPPSYPSWREMGRVYRGLLLPLQPHVTLFWLSLPIHHHLSFMQTQSILLPLHPGTVPSIFLLYLLILHLADPYPFCY